MNKTIDNIKCPKCGAEIDFNNAAYNTDEIDFSYTGTGHYNADCICPVCRKGFRMYFEFTYNITSEWSSK